jgi:predicted transcriptional regulator of viral defense system
MDQLTARRRLDEWDRREGRNVFTFRDLAKVFPEVSRKTLQEGINRLRHHGLLQAVARGIYVYPLATPGDPYRLERIAKAMRRGEYSYVSLESALSEYGAISQIPVDRLTVMTTGRKGSYRTPYGTIEFTHTRRRVSELMERMRDVGRPLRLATPEAAWADLKRVGRNTHLVDTEMMNNKRVKE